MTKSTSWYADRYTSRFNMALVPLKPRSKLPIADDWGNNTLTGAAAVEYWKDNPHNNIGMALGPSGLCSLDIDCTESWATILEEFGIDASDLEKVPTIKGKGVRHVFRVPAGMALPYHKLSWRRKDDKTKSYSVFELRAAEGDKQRFDCLPPSIHPDTGEPFKWIVQPQVDWPEPPKWLLAIWTAWDKFKPQLQAACPWAEQPAPRKQEKPKQRQSDSVDVIGAFNDAHDLPTMLERYGYKRKGRTRYLSPHSSTGLPGVVMFPDGASCWVHHASDPLCSEESGHPVSCFDLFCHYEHNDDLKAAVKQAADMLGLKRERSAPEMPPEMPPQERAEPAQTRQDTQPPPKQDSAPRLPFRCLGFDDGHYYYLPRSTTQVTSIAAGGHYNKSHLMSIAPLEWFESAFPAKDGADWLAATNAMMRWSEKVGTFDPARIRGRGAWFDAGRSVLHLGDRLLVDGISVAITDLDTKYIYEKKPALEAFKPEGEMTDADSRRMLEICMSLNWQHKVNGCLFAGWLVLAPICGALSWRPHIWMTAQRGSGKTWVVDNIITPALGGTALTVQSNSTEAGIRQKLRQDARPVVFDEAEGEKHSDRQRMQSVLELARQASSDSLAEIAKGTAGGKALSFKVRSMFLMSSINVGLAQASDKSRFSVLTLVRPAPGVEGRRQFESLEQAVNSTLTREYCAALRARTYKLIPVIRKNAKTLAKAAAEHIGNQRAGDQLGALLAGAWSLGSSSEITPTEAAEWVAGYDWGMGDDDIESDEAALASEIMHAQIRFESKTGARTRAISELIQHITGEHYDPEIGEKDAEAALARHGLRIKDDRLYVSESHPELRKILKDTSWGGSWGRILERLPGADKVNLMRFSGVRHRAIGIPLTSLM